MIEATKLLDKSTDIPYYPSKYLVGFSERDKMTIGQERQQQILKESISLITEEGLEGVTMRKVAQRVGITEASAYRYYPNKRDLLSAVISSMSCRLLQPIRDLSSSDIPANEKLEQIVAHHIGFVLAQDGLPLVFLTEVAGSKNLKLADKIQEIMSEMHQIYVDTIIEFLPKENSQSAELLALPLMGLSAVLALQRRVGIKSAIQNDVSQVLLPAMIRSLSEMSGSISRDKKKVERKK